MVSETYAIAHAISSVSSATLSSGFSTTTQGSWVSIGLSITPAAGSYLILHALTCANGVAFNTLQFGIGIGGANPSVVTALFNDAAVSLGTDYLMWSWTQEVSAPNGSTTYTVYLWSNSNAGTVNVRQGLATDPLNSANVPTNRLLGLVFN